MSQIRMNRFELKKKAIVLRKQGLSYKEIKQKIFVAKSTLSLWLKNIELKPEHKQRLYTKMVVEYLSKGPRSQKERRQKEIAEIVKNAEKEIELPIPFEVMRLMGAGIYWAEGTKRGLCEVTNSDPNLILFMTKWFKTVFNISSKALKARLNIYPQQDEKEIKNFWSDLTGIPISNFGKSFVKPKNKGYKKNTLYYGTIKIEVPKSVNMKHRIFGWVNKALKDVAPKVKLAQRKWESISKIERPIPINLRST